MNTTRLPAKLRVESGGVTLISTGGSESLGPPEGGTMLAQPGLKARYERKANTKKTGKSFFIAALQT